MTPALEAPEAMSLLTIAELCTLPARQGHLALGLDAATRALEVFGVPADRADIAARLVLVHALQWREDTDTIGELRADLLALVQAVDAES